MSKQYICNGTTFTFGKNTIALPITPPNLPSEITVEGVNLQLKTRFHISLVCIGKLIEKHSITIPDFYEQVIAEFCEYQQEHDLSQFTYVNDFYFVSQNERRSVVVMCEIPAINGFFDRINAALNLNLDYPSLHLTLYTLQPNVGIFLIDDDAFSELANSVENQEIENLFEMLDSE